MHLIKVHLMIVFIYLIWPIWAMEFKKMLLRFTDLWKYELIRTFRHPNTMESLSGFLIDTETITGFFSLLSTWKRPTIFHSFLAKVVFLVLKKDGDRRETLLLKVSKSQKQISKFAFEPKTIFFLYFCLRLCSATIILEWVN